MNIEPAHIDQILQASDGHMVAISSDAGMVVDDLKRIDSTLGVRFAEHGRPPFFAVFCQPDERSTYLVMTVKARQNKFGVWEGLDKRVVKEIERIGSDSYDYAAEVQKKNENAERAREQRIHDRIEVASYEGYRMLRKILGRNCGHMSVSREL